MHDVFVKGGELNGIRLENQRKIFLCIGSKMFACVLH